MENFKEKFLNCLPQGDPTRQLWKTAFANQTEEEAIRDYVSEIIMDMKASDDWDGVKVNVGVAAKAVACEACKQFSTLCSDSNEFSSKFEKAAAELFREYCLN